MSSPSERIIKRIDEISNDLIEIAKYIHDNPELGYVERKAVKILTKFLEDHGFKVKRNLIGLETAFKASYKGAGRKDKPKIALLAEYDALPEIGHACGHNLICTMSIGAAIGLKEVLDEVDGTIIVLGCPAEESSAIDELLAGAKVYMVEKGIFDDIDVALMLHPADRTALEMETTALEALEFTYHGKAAHAAVAPWEGVNALNAIIELFNNINALRQHLKPDVRVHGIITEGGVAPNIVPEKAQAKFYIRAKNKDYLKIVVDKIKNCARAAELATGAKLSIRKFEHTFYNIITNKTLAQIVKKYFEKFGESVADIFPGGGSTDMGNVSWKVPSVHAMIRVAPKGTVPHTHEFAKATKSELAHKMLIIGAKVLALTSLEILLNRDLLMKIKEEFKKTIHIEQTSN